MRLNRHYEINSVNGYFTEVVVKDNPGKKNQAIAFLKALKNCKFENEEKLAKAKDIAASVYKHCNTFSARIINLFSHLFYRKTKLDRVNNIFAKINAAKVTSKFLSYKEGKRIFDLNTEEIKKIEDIHIPVKTSISVDVVFERESIKVGVIYFLAATKNEKEVEALLKLFETTYPKQLYYDYRQCDSEEKKLNAIKQFQQAGIFSLPDDLDYYFHGTNSTAVASIQKNGLDATAKNFDTAQLLKISKLFDRVAPNSYAFMFSKRDTSKKIVCLTQDLYGAITYAFASPEWFMLFNKAIDGSTNYSHHRSIEEKKQDYLESFSALESRTLYWKSEGKISEEEASEIIEFFNKYWNFYANCRPVVVVSKTLYNSLFYPRCPRYIRENSQINIKIEPEELEKYKEALSRENLEYFFL